MTDSPHTLLARLTWVRTYHETRNAGLTCRRCGISRPTLRKWVRRFDADGLPGLQSRDRTPHRLAPTKLTPELVERVLTMRRTRNLGSKRLQAELLREGGIRLSTSTLHKALSRAAVPPLRRPKRERRFKRYNRPHAGDRVQIDSMKVAGGLYQFTAIDDCTRLRVLGLYPTAKQPRQRTSSKHRCCRRCLSPSSASSRTGAASSSPSSSMNHRWYHRDAASSPGEAAAQQGPLTAPQRQG